MNNREIDALVAKHVMGEPKPDYACDTEDWVDWVKADMAVYSKGGNWELRNPLDGDWTPIPFVRNIAAAWRVIGAIDERGWYWEISRGKNQVHATIITDEETDSIWFNSAKTAPMAICLTALEAVGVEVGDETN